MNNVFCAECGFWMNECKCKDKTLSSYAVLAEVSDAEMKCHICKSDMKEGVLYYQCRNLYCRTRIQKKFS